MIRLLRFSSVLAFVATLLVFGAITGCKDGKSTGKKDESAKAKDKGKHEDDHPSAGPHGGPLAEWEEIFHAEFTVDHTAKKAIVYILDDTAKAAPKIDPAKITKVKLTILGSSPLIAIDLTHDAKLSDAKGIAFVGVNDYFAKPTDFKGNISGNIDDGKKNEPYNGDFEFKAPKNAQLFLVPGGIYTAADIKANGNTTPSEKFKGKTWKHGEKKPGDKICPITKKKAEAEFAWVVQGQRYEFCCPPCLDRFLTLAHNDPAKIKNAEKYVHE